MRADRKEERLADEEKKEEVEEEKNVMPSMVVRQQKLYHGGATEATRFEQHPVTTTQNLPAATSGTTLKLMKATKEATSGEPTTKTFDQDGLVLPKRLTHHMGGGGCGGGGLSGRGALNAGQPIIRDLNRELKFNQVRGKNVLDQKSELKRALEKLEDNRRKKELEQERLSRRTSLELRLEERAERLAKESGQVEDEEDGRLVKRSLAFGFRRKNESGTEQRAAANLSDASATCEPAAANPSGKPALINFSIKSMTR